MLQLVQVSCEECCFPFKMSLVVLEPYMNGSCGCRERTNSSLHVTWPLAQSTMNVTYYLTNAKSNFTTFTNSCNVTNLNAGESYRFSVSAKLRESSDKESPAVECVCSTGDNILPI